MKSRISTINILCLIIFCPYLRFFNKLMRSKLCSLIRFWRNLTKKDSVDGVKYNLKFCFTCPNRFFMTFFHGYEIRKSFARLSKKIMPYRWIVLSMKNIAIYWLLLAMDKKVLARGYLWSHPVSNRTEYIRKPVSTFQPALENCNSFFKALISRWRFCDFYMKEYTI